MGSVGDWVGIAAPLCVDSVVWVAVAVIGDEEVQ